MKSVTMMILVAVCLPGNLADTSKLAGRWKIVWNNKSLERWLGKQTISDISQNGTFRFVSPERSRIFHLSKSTNARFPPSIGWYHLRLHDKTWAFLRMNDNERLEVHLFSKENKYSCNRIYNTISKYCTTAVGTRQSVLELDTKNLAGRWKIVWNNKLLERWVGKQITVLISRTGTFEVVSPDTGGKHSLSKSTNAKFPSSMGWYHLDPQDGTFAFLQLKHDGRMEVHLFAKKKKVPRKKDIPCNSTYNSIPSYCTGAVGTKQNVADQVRKTNASTTQQQKAIAWCFGYGSLVNSYAHKAKYVEVVMNYRRVWNAWQPMARTTFLGLEPTDNRYVISGVIYPIFSQQELDQLDAREVGYKKKDIPHKDVKVLNEGLTDEVRSMKVDPSAQLFAYVPEKGGNKPNALYPIVQSYVDLCANGFLKFRSEQLPRDSNDPLRRFLDTTYGWSKYMLNDRVHARRPSKYKGNSIVIEDYLDDVDDAHDIPPALLPEDYAVMYQEELRQGLKLIVNNRVKYNSDL